MKKNKKQKTVDNFKKYTSKLTFASFWCYVIPRSCVATRCVGFKSSPQNLTFFVRNETNSLPAVPQVYTRRHVHGRCDRGVTTPLDFLVPKKIATHVWLVKKRPQPPFYFLPLSDCGPVCGKPLIVQVVCLQKCTTSATSNSTITGDHSK